MIHPADDTLPQLTLHLPDEAATLALGADMARILVPGLVFYLDGNLGAGKTTLVRGIMRGLGYEGKVKSPTYTLVELYAISRLNLYHFDLYRFADPIEWEEAGFREYFNAHSICLVEWPEKAGDWLPRPDMRVLLRMRDGGRTAELKAETEAGKRWLSQLRDTIHP
ncbi:tRNA (adenosine(37)-N6)-threonylcarbamoyltransferase complex ATPase subunit type 1 TsaE [Sulfuriferula plumbiphila]|uniref:tRNA threonylcarbamoyladenosine biosynthesis protein TsaE n=1 Tax=Sulfuriferula plumbiphila TaxID=171865 RepID=A0A512L7K5_9PROT|nr:tRNA (adenosine(37)-N6)-threonylcarbamoyltransferase complex ATPase subunit type 1 TsaE [Sulfuriferula plumbiphila]BBP04036.1 tRNA (adenosine(37)-N6)-threonylcarbamoyltransferase complex ATPase subunit type 1 TsaE [Sulfuriferula plumbiphila]GEP30447.1 tRNA (adenosine(37)-N6)-threonylcarbamoyltransferase complex ATPase subunit type 1 TsaE [Sulfuriferula plumbiphila]